tara:strand:- start:3411 stop:4475 length:1065 start_codon:yes stop_codon:yes gene_type:complete
MLSEIIQPVLAAPACARERLIERLKITTPPQTLCAQEDVTKSSFRYKYSALQKYLHIQVNPANTKCWLVFDLDGTDPFIWEDKLLPPPNIIVSGQGPKAKLKQNSAHLFYAIQNVPTSQRSRRKPINFLTDIRRKMTSELMADNAYTDPLCKNPLHPFWKTSFLHEHEYNLNELNDGFERPEMYKRGDFDWDNVPDSRNCTVFHELRFEAYHRVTFARKNWSYEQWEQHLFQLADYLNDFTGKDLSKTHQLPLKELSSIVRSVSQWTRLNYNPAHNRGVTGLWNLPIQAITKKLAQQEGARYTHRTRQEKTKQHLLEARSRLIKRGERLTQINLAKESGLTRQTVAKYIDVLKC